MPLTWQAFALAAPAGTRAHYLAAVVGQPVAAVQALRGAAGAGRRGRGKAAGFAALFAQWHGRDPEPADWPAPLRCGQGSYEWQAPEDALLASLVGRMDADAIAGVLTERLRQVTGDPQARRNAMAVKLRTNRLGLVSSDLGYTIQEAAARLRVPEAWIHERIADGTIRISRARWDRRRLYVTAPMLERLKLARKQGPKARKPSSAWLQLSAAAALAGLSTATIHNWAAAGDLTSRPGSDGTYYSRRSVLARARRYWKRPKFKRAVPPAWFQSEVARANA